MNCQKCRKEIPDDAVFCQWCGKKLISSHRKPKRSPNGSGCAYKRGCGWVAQAVIGYRELPADIMDPSNKRQRIPIKRTKAGFATKADALAYVPTLLAGGVLKPTEAPTLAYYWKNYEKNELSSIGDSKQTAYRIAWDKLSKLHDARIDQLTVTDLRSIVAEKCTTYYTAKDCRTVLTALYKLAGADGYANKDLPSFIQLPKLTEQEREPFNDVEQANLWKLYESGDIRAGIPLLMIYTGLMPGECFDLRIEMIDLKNRQIVGAGKKTTVRKKTPVTIAATIVPVLEDLMAHARPSGRLFTASEDLWRKDYYGALEAAKCRHLPPYSCRHTTATALAITEGVAPQTIRKVMRWSTTKMLDRYAHPDIEDAKAAVDAIRRKPTTDTLPTPNAEAVAN
jgi:integrase